MRIVRQSANPIAVRLEDGRQLLIGQLRGCGDMLGGLDHDLGPAQSGRGQEDHAADRAELAADIGANGRKAVRHDAEPPARPIRARAGFAIGQDLVRSIVLLSGAEGTGLALAVVAMSRFGTLKSDGAKGPLRGDDRPPAADRIATELGFAVHVNHFRARIAVKSHGVSGQTSHENSRAGAFDPGSRLPTDNYPPQRVAQRIWPYRAGRTIHARTAVRRERAGTNGRDDIRTSAARRKRTARGLQAGVIGDRPPAGCMPCRTERRPRGTGLVGIPRNIPSFTTGTGHRLLAVGDPPLGHVLRMDVLLIDWLLSILSVLMRSLFTVVLPVGTSPSWMISKFGPTWARILAIASVW